MHMVTSLILEIILHAICHGYYRANLKFFKLSCTILSGFYLNDVSTRNLVTKVINVENGIAGMIASNKILIKED